MDKTVSDAELESGVTAVGPALVVVAPSRVPLPVRLVPRHTTTKPDSEPQSVKITQYFNKLPASEPCPFPGLARTREDVENVKARSKTKITDFARETKVTITRTKRKSGDLCSTPAVTSSNNKITRISGRALLLPEDTGLLKDATGADGSAIQVTTTNVKQVKHVADATRIFRTTSTFQSWQFRDAPACTSKAWAAGTSPAQPITYMDCDPFSPAFSSMAPAAEPVTIVHSEEEEDVHRASPTLVRRRPRYTRAQTLPVIRVSSSSPPSDSLQSETHTSSPVPAAPGTFSPNDTNIDMNVGTISNLSTHMRTPSPTRSRPIRFARSRTENELNLEGRRSRLMRPPASLPLITRGVPASPDSIQLLSALNRGQGFAALNAFKGPDRNVRTNIQSPRVSGAPNPNLLQPFL
ncbi:hypothetical protein HKX48_000663 [Thoreauomyces humboldtii]|nr:hypothetical protein HKX48_000663 [Thoreauomyces humboldtii]